MASTDEGDLSPSAMEARDGQLKVDHAKALKNRVYGLVKQSQPDETTFRQAVRDMRKAMEEIERDVTRSIEEATRNLLKNQVARAQEKALERLSNINPALSSIDQVENIEGNPPKREVPLAKIPSIEELSGNGSAFETVTGTGNEDRSTEDVGTIQEEMLEAGRSQETNGAARPARRGAPSVPGRPGPSREEAPMQENTRAKVGKKGKKARQKEERMAQGANGGARDPSVDKLEDELRRAEARTKEIREQLTQRQGMGGDRNDVTEDAWKTCAIRKIS